MTADNATEHKTYKQLASETSLEHGGKIPKGSEAAREQSEHDKREAEAAQGRGYVGHVAARSVEQSIGQVWNGFGMDMVCVCDGSMLDKYSNSTQQ
ncbi:hypothetical protein EON63_16745 [archaeon]|nr:MAG: hypothetical protein EON63_16745 [archaeon]